jgi:hypothetical protein
VIVHHADVIRQSLAAQLKAREISKKTSAKYRAKDKDSADVTHDVTRHVTPNADRQTDKQPREEGSSEEQIDWVTGEVFPSSDCSVCGKPLENPVQRQHGMCNRHWTQADAQKKQAS